MMALEGSTTLISLLRIPEANCLYVLYLYNLSSGPSNDSLHCCLYWYQAACRNHLFIHTGLNPGCWVMHVGFSHSPLVTASLSLFVICAMSWQHMHASVLPLMWQLLQDHLLIDRKQQLNCSTFIMRYRLRSLINTSNWEVIQDNNVMFCEIQMSRTFFYYIICR